MLREVELDAEWDSAKAERWWQMHRPQATGRRSEIRNQETVPMEAA
jgi:hypothetical protein